MFERRIRGHVSGPGAHVWLGYGVRMRTHVFEVLCHYHAGHVCSQCRFSRLPSPHVAPTTTGTLSWMCPGVSWMCPGCDVLDLSWICPGNVLNVYGFCVLDVSWMCLECLGCVLDVLDVLDASWMCLGCVLDFLESCVLDRC